MLGSRARATLGQQQQHSSSARAAHPSSSEPAPTIRTPRERSISIYLSFGDKAAQLCVVPNNIQQIERYIEKRAEQTADDPADRLAEHTRYKLYDQYYRDSTRWIVTSRFKQLTPPNLPRVNQLPAVYSSGAGVATPSMPPECGKGSTRGRHGGARGAPSSAAVDASVVGGSAVFGAVLVAPEDARWVGRLAHLAAHARHHLGRRVVMVEVAHAPATPATG
eukprot:scaffold111654_cov58-Phaeocystis_antarctica.AAC.1